MLEGMNRAIDATGIKHVVVASILTLEEAPRGLSVTVRQGVEVLSMLRLALIFA